ncbi:oxidoreductase [Rhodococcoides trifolii]|uniref:Oxidoreductase n=1 Tax=Rhodococcoides trifolii TaxID=908250 RepID=A0A917FSX8_9NOCA|nr:aldo/keto reductase [Rhodococcus trifolii]GGG02426.1 oxidoreductase [Rhodococcus trifolii]
MTKLASVTLGDGLTVSAQGFGGMALTPVYGDVDPDTSLETLHHAVDVGVTFLDTANVYGGGDNEKLFALLLKDRRDEVTVATKFGITGNPSTGERTTRGGRDYARHCIDESLGRLGIDTVDLYYMHRLDPNVPIEETVGAMAELVTEGKVRHLGLSEVTAAELERAVAIHPIAAIQSEWSVWSRDVETRVVPAAARLGVGFVPYSPLGRGFLTGTVDSSTLGDADMRRHFPRFADGVLEANSKALDVVRAVAAQTGATPAQVALAWLYRKGTDLGLPVVPIPGTRTATRIDENAAATTLVLTDAQVTELDGIDALVSGARSADPNWVSSGRE